MSILRDPAAALQRLRDLGNQLGDHFANDARSRHVATKWVRGGLVVAGALMAGVAQFVPTPKEGIPWNVVMGICGASFAAVGGLWSLLAEDTAPAALETARRTLEEAKEAILAHRDSDLELEAQIENVRWLSGLYSTAVGLREVVENLISTPPLTDDGLQHLLLDTISRPLQGLLTFEGGEYWTLAILRYVEEGDRKELRCVAHQRSDRAHERKDHRAWGIGEGIAGHAYQTGREIIIPDATDQERAGWLHIPQSKYDPDDANRYQSMAAIPIRVSGAGKLWGVVVATSDKPQRFTSEPSGIAGMSVPDIEPLRLLAGMVALAAAPQSSHKDGEPDQRSAPITPQTVTLPKNDSKREGPNGKR